MNKHWRNLILEEYLQTHQQQRFQCHLLQPLLILDYFIGIVIPSNSVNVTLILKLPECLELPDDSGECIGDDCEEDDDGDEKDENGGQDQPHIRPGQSFPVLTILEQSHHDYTHIW